MTKTSSTIILILFIVVLAFVGVFTFIPTFNYGEYGEFYSPATLIQKSTFFTKSLKTTYSVDLDDDVTTNAQIRSIISKRLSSIYGIYGATLRDISTSDNTMAVTIPESVVRTDAVTASAMMEVVSARGNLEILNESTYDATKVVLSGKHFRNAKIQTMVSGENKYYIAVVNLNKEGKEALKNLTATSGTYAIDGTVTLTGGVQVFNDSTLYLYGYTMQDAKELVGYVNSGVLGAELKMVDSVQVETVGGLVLAIALATVVVGLAIFFIVRYKLLGLVAILSQITMIVVATIFAGLVHLEIFNLFAVIGLLMGIALHTYFTVYAFDKIKGYQDSTFAAAKYKGFANANKLNLIVHGIVLVVGIILWVIPTVVTAPMGNVLVYLAVMSFVATMGLNRLFANLIEPFVEGKKSTRK